MTQQELRGEAARVVGVVAGVLMGMWLLFLFGVALAWDPLDRRLGFYARRRTARLAAFEEDDPVEAQGYGFAVTQE
jgi:hypothetical protein